MFRPAFRAVCVVMIVVLAACGGSENSEPVVSLAPTPVPAGGDQPDPVSSGGLPDDWFVVSSDNQGMMLENSRDEDAWIWITIEPSLRKSDLGEAVKRHRKSVEESPEGTYNDSGSIETSKHGTGMWSWGSYEADEGDLEGKHELVLFVSHPRRDAVLGMLYLYPLGDTNFESRLAELVAVADGLQKNS